jgi:hypothetical protein
MPLAKQHRPFSSQTFARSITTSLNSLQDNSESIQDAKKRALIWAAGAHLIGLLILAIVQVKPAPQAASEIVAINSVDSEQTPAWKKVAPPAPAAAAAAPSMQPLVAMGTSAVVMPEVDFSPTATELNVGSSFGTFGGGSASAGGAVSFLGNQGKGNHVVFVVDVSGSMSASAEVDGKIISRMDLLKKELTKSIGNIVFIFCDDLTMQAISAYGIRSSCWRRRTWTGSRRRA